MDAETTEMVRTREAGGRETAWHRGAWQTGIVALLLAACGGLMLLVTAKSRQALPVLGSVVGDFTLTDQEGRPFESSSLRGKAWVASFIFTNCRDTCPCITTNLTLLQESVQADPRLRSGVRFVSFSVDPERDSPRELKAYAERYGADTGLWVFLTGKKGDVLRLSQEVFQLSAAPAPRKDGTGNASEIIHSDRFTLVDQEGRLRGYYRPEPGDLKRLVSDLGRCLDEVR